MRRTFTLPLAICIEDIVPVLTVEQDYTTVRGNALASGDEAEDRKCEDEIIRRLNDGDVWAWAVVNVSVSTLGFTGQAHLGACSYNDEHDFRVGDGANYQQMVAEACDDLAQKLYDAGFVMAGTHSEKIHGFTVIGRVVISSSEQISVVLIDRGADREGRERYVTAQHKAGQDEWFWGRYIDGLDNAREDFRIRAGFPSKAEYAALDRYTSTLR